MMNKFVIIAVVAIFAVAHGATLSSNYNTNVVSLEKHGKLIDVVPTIGSLVYKGIKFASFLLKSSWSLVGLKLAAIALAGKVVIWLLKHGISVIIGAVAMFGFCKISGKCSLEYVPKEFVEVGENLVYAAKQLQNGADLYEDNLVY